MLVAYEACKKLDPFGLTRAEKDCGLTRADCPLPRVAVVDPSRPGRPLPSLPQPPATVGTVSSILVLLTAPPVDRRHQCLLDHTSTRLSASRGRRFLVAGNSTTFHSSTLRRSAPHRAVPRLISPSVRQSAAPRPSHGDWRTCAVDDKVCE